MNFEEYHSNFFYNVVSFNLAGKALKICSVLDVSIDMKAALQNTDRFNCSFSAAS